MDNTVDNFESLLEEFSRETVDNTVYKDLFYGDLILQAIVDNTVDNCDLADSLIFAAELALMDSIATIQAGDLVAWDASIELH